VQTERGAAAVEFALFSMFLILILCGIVDLGRGIYTAIALDDAVQEGVMFALYTDEVADNPVTAQDIRLRVSSSTDTPALNPADVTVTCVEQLRSRQSASRVTVGISHSVDLVTPFVSDWFGGEITITRTATGDRFFSACPEGSTP
jgi:Flp pilus assembly protein TadG